MSLPKTFNFKLIDSESIYTAEEKENRFDIYYQDKKLYPIDTKTVAKFVGRGDWEIIKDNPIGNYESIGTKIGQLVDKKNMQYGDSFNKSGQILEILYPNGVQPNQYRDMQAVTRIIDKLMRIANGNQGDENAYEDLAGYGILMSGGENE